MSDKKQKLKDYLWKNRTTMEEFAKDIGCSTGRLSQIFNSDSEPRSELSKKIRDKIKSLTLKDLHPGLY